MSKAQIVTLQVTLAYSGKEVGPKAVQDLVRNALEHCRQESMLSDPEWDETSCNAVDVVLGGGIGNFYREEVTE